MYSYINLLEMWLDRWGRLGCCERTGLWSAPSEWSQRTGQLPGSWFVRYEKPIGERIEKITERYGGDQNTIVWQ